MIVSKSTPPQSTACSSHILPYSANPAWHKGPCFHMLCIKNTADKLQGELTIRTNEGRSNCAHSEIISMRAGAWQVRVTWVLARGA
jgi:hypothetical protein